MVVLSHRLPLHGSSQTETAAKTVPLQFIILHKRQQIVGDTCVYTYTHYHRIHMHTLHDVACVYSMIHFLSIHKHLLLQVHNTILTHICTYVPIHTCVYIASQTFRNKQIMFYACIYVHMSILSLLNMVLRIVKGYQLCE